MDEKNNRTAQPSRTIAFLNDHNRTFSLNGSRVALFDIDDPELESMLVDSGVVLCNSDDSMVDIIVVDSANVNAEILRERLSNDVINRLYDGDAQVVGRSLLSDYFDRQEPAVHRLYTRVMLADLLGVPVSTIRSWQRRGLIQPVSKVSKLSYFDFQEVSAAKQLATLVELGIQPATIERNLKQLSTWLPTVDRPLTQLSVLVEGKKILLRQADGLVEPGGQKRLNFEHARESPRRETAAELGPNIIPFDRFSADLNQHNELVDMAGHLEEAGELHEAIEVYRSMQLAFGPDAETCLRIGELLFRLGDLHGARERYFMAIELDEGMVEARAALGCVLNELGQTDFAISAFEGALRHHPDYADVHFQLAQTLQAAGNDMQALKHWRRFVSLSPTGPWADEASSQIEFLQRRSDYPTNTVTDR